ncbi:MAG: ribonuclease P protein component [Candidatus Cloacimonetes bacterium]|nr:ribonuclease P protein component [Candidatus Cloacimonadota bacterium]MDD3234876.1 ribonuclease P protein component [Candidatus Cloacimonadota bacterium]
MVRWITSHAEYTEFRNPDFQLRTAYFYVPGLNRVDETAVGITISRKVGNAVCRNLLKRRIKAWIRENITLIPEGFKLVISAKNGAGELSWQGLSEQMSTLIALLTKRLST